MSGCYYCGVHECSGCGPDETAVTLDGVDRITPDPREWLNHNPFTLVVYVASGGKIGISYHSDKGTCGGGGYAPSLDALKKDWALSDEQVDAVVECFTYAGVIL